MKNKKGRASFLKNKKEKRSFLKNKKVDAGFLKNKKALVGAGIEWIVVTPVIIFILVIFLVFGFVLFQADKLTGGGEIQLTGRPEIAQNFESAELFEAYLNSPVEFDGETIKMKRAFVLYLDGFFNVKSNIGMSLAEYGKTNYYTFNNLGEIIYERSTELAGEGFDGDDLKKLSDKRDILISDSREIFNSLCNKYYLQAPFGTISENEFLPDGMDEFPGGKVPVFADVDVLSKDFDPVLFMESPYKGETIEFKYRQLRKC